MAVLTLGEVVAEGADVLAEQITIVAIALPLDVVPLLVSEVVNQVDHYPPPFRIAAKASFTSRTTGKRSVG